MKVKRYFARDLNFGCMEQDVDGDWVRYSDIEPFIKQSLNQNPAAEVVALQKLENESQDLTPRIVALTSSLKVGQRLYEGSQQKSCTWSQHDDINMPSTYEGACGVLWTFTEDGPKENGLNFCPKCGGSVNQKGVKHD